LPAREPLIHMTHEFRVHCPSIQTVVLATCAEVVRRPVREATSLSTDTRDDMRGACFVALRGERFDGHDFVPLAAAGGAAFAIVERVPDEAQMALLPPEFGILRVASTRAALGAMAHAWRKSILRLRVVAVTGSAGKTTTRRLLEGILSEAGVTHASPKSFNNDIGVPLTLLSTPDDARFLVAEVGMNHPGEILPLAELVEPEVGIVTLAGRAHLEGLGSVAAIATEKASLLCGVSAQGVAVVNGDNPPLLEAVEALVAEDSAPERIVRFGVGAHCHYRLVGRRPAVGADGRALEGRQELEVSVPRAFAQEQPDHGSGGNQRYTIAMAGEHNALNALAAIAAATEMRVPDEAIRAGLAKVAAADMRLERLEVAGRVVFNDAYNANPDAMIASLTAFAELAVGATRRTAILGEMRELGTEARALHEEVGQAAAARLHPGDALVAVGPFAAALVDAARAAGFAGDVLAAEGFSESFAADAARLIPSNGAVLLKGSRGARMERFLDPLRTAFAATDQGH
jgi:UDP-N-acetylmuramoyl-tripeptide--D-alanyl-D-alanine ligase